MSLLEKLLDRCFRSMEIRNGCESADPKGPVYLKRWYLKDYSDGVTKPAVLLHKFLSSDPDDALHDHPWGFTSIILTTGYVEETERGMHFIPPLSIITRDANHRHRVHILKTTWTLVITGPKEKSWSFFVKGVQIPWRDYLAAKC